MSAIDGLKTLIRRIPVIRTFYKVLMNIKTLGLRQTAKKVYNKLFVRFRIPRHTHKLSLRERERQLAYPFASKPLISILVPLYNTPTAFLEDMIESVQAQTYSVWELCLADASDAEHAKTQEICTTYAQTDRRINYLRLAQNDGISGNTNQCILMAKGDYFALLDHDDILHRGALFEIACAIERTGADLLYTDEGSFRRHPRDMFQTHFKPDFAPDTLRSYNYICHLTVFSRQLQQKVGLFRSQFDGSQDYDMILRLTEQAQTITHIPQILYYWRAHAGSVAGGVEAKTYAIDAAKGALTQHLRRVGLAGTVEDASIPTVYKINYVLASSPLITIIIPNKDHVDDLDRCLRSIADKTSYQNYELVIVENNSEDPATFDYYGSLDPAIKVITYQGPFNFSAINNQAAHQAQGDYLLFLNNDVEVITGDWLQEMLMFAQRSDVAAVGAKLYYPDQTVQHAGVILGIGGVAGHAHKGLKRAAYGYASRLQLAQNVSAVTAACLLVHKERFDAVGGFDEALAVAFNDVDFCLKLRQQGLLNVFTPFAELYHFESKSRGLEDTPQKQARFAGEINHFTSRWGERLEQGDPYYNTNLTLKREDFSLKRGDWE